MNRLALGARTALLGAICRALTGRGIPAEDRERLSRQLDLAGFRKGARAYLLGRLSRRGARPSETTLLAPALDGLFTIAIAGSDAAVGEEILVNAVYEPHVVAFYRRTLRPGMSVLDVGANIGFHALHAGVLVGPGGRVFAVEPDPGNAALLRLSLLVRPGGLPVEVIEAALSDEGGELILSDLGNAANSGARFTHRDRRVLDGLVHGPDPRFRSVRAFAWDAERGGERVDFVKIDVEGFEPYALRGLERSLARWRPCVLSEFAPANLATIGGIDPWTYPAWFRERGYACSIVAEDGSLLEGADDAIRVRLGTQHHLDLAFLPR